VRMIEDGCNGCGYIFPISEMYSVSDKVKTGESTRYTRQSNGLEQKSGRTEHYGSRHRYFCGPCYKHRIKIRVLGFGALALIVGGGAAAKDVAALFSASPYAADARSVEHPEATRQTLTDAGAASDKPSIEDDRAAEEPMVEAATGSPEPSVAETSEDTTVETVAPEASSTAPALTEIAAAQAAGQKALVSGKPERWRDGSMRGYAVPSEQMVGGCRTITYSEDKGAAPQTTKELCQ
jgi:hypothetical protein